LALLLPAARKFVARCGRQQRGERGQRQLYCRQRGQRILKQRRCTGCRCFLCNVSERVSFTSSSAWWRAFVPRSAIVARCVASSGDGGKQRVKRRAPRSRRQGVEVRVNVGVAGGKVIAVGAFPGQEFLIILFLHIAGLGVLCQPVLAPGSSAPGHIRFPCRRHP
jgi:hypothetical protein